MKEKNFTVSRFPAMVMTVVLSSEVVVVRRSKLQFLWAKIFDDRHSGISGDDERLVFVARRN